MQHVAQPHQRFDHKLQATMLHSEYPPLAKSIERLHPPTQSSHVGGSNGVNNCVNILSITQGLRHQSKSGGPIVGHQSKSGGAHFSNHA